MPSQEVTADCQQLWLKQAVYGQVLDAAVHGALRVQAILALVGELLAHIPGGVAIIGRLLCCGEFLGGSAEQVSGITVYRRRRVGDVWLRPGKSDGAAYKYECQHEQTHCKVDDIQFEFPC